ncbi:group 1 glycosyl transferase (plasmid) [Telmatobacter bradus]|uniref:group 1 glycosyl transferase n=1 Tax=Telmatobacter bradus TaxID=474953 RepID=UPI003B429584
MNRAACTIVSLNYLAYARTLCESFLEFHPDSKFYVLLVDRIPEGLDLSNEKFELMLVEDLQIHNFDSIAFRYGIVELNTNVKATFLKRLLNLGVDQLIYFDPDILICSSADIIYDSLAKFKIVLTPHCTSPNQDDPYAEIMLLGNGIFNLGFIAVSKSDEAERFLSWWEHRCLTYGYNERWTGLFVDQKWINLVPCYFDSVEILKHLGCNVAYWNLHERVLAKNNSSWVVNDTTPLVFYHFSGVNVDGDTRISKYADQFNLDSRNDLKDLFTEYRDRLVKNGIRNYSRSQYAFGSYSNGELVNNLQRAAFAANLERFGTENPFDANGSFYKWAKQHHLQSRQDSVGKFNRKTYSRSDKRVRIVNMLLRIALRLLGADRYTILMKYFEYGSVLRNQKDVYGDH